jgi:hypothetical protein
MAAVKRPTLLARRGLLVATLPIRSIIRVHLIGVIVQVMLGTTSTVRFGISLVSSTVVGIALVCVIVASICMVGGWRCLYVAHDVAFGCQSNVYISGNEEKRVFGNCEPVNESLFPQHAGIHHDSPSESTISLSTIAVIYNDRFVLHRSKFIRSTIRVVVFRSTS